LRNRFADTFYRLGRDDPRLCVVVADISPAGSIAKFRESFPERFVNVGVSEQLMIGMVAGLALRGLKPFAYTIATFALYRPFEMVRDDLAYQNLPVTVVGIGGGVTYSTLGGTHHAQEDVAVACSVPNLSVISPCDPLEVEQATIHCATNTGGPIYLRLGKAGEPNFTETAIDGFAFGKLRYIRRGADSCVMSYGPTMKIAAEVAAALEAAGESVSLVSAHTLKPLDRAGVEGALAMHRRVIIIEETSPQNGLGPKVKQVAWDMRAACDLRTFALQDEFLHVYGGHADLLAAHGLSADRILRALREKERE